MLTVGQIRGILTVVGSEVVNIATPFGQFLKDLRAAHRETAQGMAEKLGISRGYLFSVEAGKRNIPSNWPERLRDRYGLAEEEVKAMRQAILDSATIIELDVSRLSQSKKTLAHAFSRQLPSLDDPTTSKIQQILDNCKKSEKYK